jgi:hypothetical protein
MRRQVTPMPRYGWAPDVIGAVGEPEPDPQGYLDVFFAPTRRLKIYPDSAHGFLFQHHSRFAADVDDFLAAAR